MQIKVANKIIGNKAPVFVIAEIGTNHNGSPLLAKKMIEAAASAGADAVKFQIVNPKESYVKGSDSYAIFQKMNLSLSALKELKREAVKRRLIFFATAGDISSLNLILELGIPLIKISSGCMTNIKLLREAAKTGLPIIMSTGMSYMKEVEQSVRELERNGAKKIVLLHCVSRYPANYGEVNLNGMRAMQEKFKYPIGYSDHTIGSLASSIAVAIGAKVIEKHFTLDKNLKGYEHYFSADPKEFKELVVTFKNIKKMLGSCIKEPGKSEKIFRNKIRRHLVFANNLIKDSVLSEKDIAVKRIKKGKGLSSDRCDSIIGKRIKISVRQDKPIKMNLLY